jgi:hypothetical protein
MADITLSLTGANGDTVVFDNVNYLLENGASGFGRPPVSVRIDDSALDGGTFRFSRRGVREIDLPVYIFGGSRSDVETKLRRLARILDDSTGTGTVINAAYASGENWFTEGHYVNGAKTEFGENGTLTYCRWVLVFQCASPFWTRAESQSYSVGAASTAGRGLFSPNSMANMKITSSQVLGSVSVSNVGDVPALPKWIFTGPFDSVTVASGNSSFSYNAVVTAGNTISVDTATGTVVDQAGVNKYASLGSAPKLFSVPAGTSAVSITATNTTSATGIQMNFQPRKEVVF